MKLTLEQVKWYLAQTGEEEVVGEPSAACHCLAAYTLKSLYPNCAPDVHFGNMQADIDIDGDLVTVEFTPELTAAANKFDEFPGKWMNDVTRAELEKYMPELFQPEGGE